MYTVTESTKRNDEFDFIKELDSIKGRRLKCSGGCEICSRGGATGPPPPPEYAPVRGKFCEYDSSRVLWAKDTLGDLD